MEGNGGIYSSDEDNETDTLFLLQEPLFWFLKVKNDGTDQKERSSEMGVIPLQGKMKDVIMKASEVNFVIMAWDQRWSQTITDQRIGHLISQQLH